MGFRSVAAALLDHVGHRRGGPCGDEALVAEKPRGVANAATADV